MSGWCPLTSIIRTTGKAIRLIGVRKNEDDNMYSNQTDLSTMVWRSITDRYTRWNRCAVYYLLASVDDSGTIVIDEEHIHENAYCSVDDVFKTIDMLIEDGVIRRNGAKITFVV